MIYFPVTSCDSKKNDSPKEMSFKPQVSVDSSVTISQDSSMKKITELLNIGNIMAKTEGVEIRIWYNDLSLIGKLVVIKNDHGWQSSGYDYTAKVNDNFDVISLEKRLTSNEPSSGWTSFLKAITDLGMYKLKNYKHIPGYFLCTDGETVGIEIRKDNYYQSYFYPCFMLYQDSLKEVKRVKNICLFIQKEFGYQLLPGN